MRRNIIIVLIGLFVSTAFSLAGCGVGGNSTDVTMATTNKIVTTVAVIDGNNQTATIGTELPNALVVLIKNSEGQPIAGQTVNFKVISGGGSIFAGAATSDSGGYARERWTLGNISGTQKVEVRAVDSNGTAVVFASFSAIASAGAPNAVSIFSGDNQRAAQLQPLPSPVVVIVKDIYGNPVTGVSVEFATISGGLISPASVATDASGQAATVWTLGLSLGGHALTATVSGFTPLNFNATATQAVAGATTSISKISGDLQTVTQHLILPSAIVVSVTDKLGIAVPNQHVTFSSANIANTTVATDNLGKASWQGYFHASGQQKVDVSVVGLPYISFDVNVMANSHKYDGAYTCTAIKNFVITNGIIVFDKDPYYYNVTNGTINEVDGTLSAERADRFGTTNSYSGKILIDSQQQTTASGTSVNYTIITPRTPDSTGNWACTRL